MTVFLRSIRSLSKFMRTTPPNEWPIYPMVSGYFDLSNLISATNSKAELSLPLLLPCAGPSGAMT